MLVMVSGWECPKTPRRRSKHSCFALAWRKGCAQRKTRKRDNPGSLIMIQWQCFSWMIPNLYVENVCLTISIHCLFRITRQIYTWYLNQPFIDGCFNWIITIFYAVNGWKSPKIASFASFIMFFASYLCHTVDGINAAPVDMVNIPLLTGFHTSCIDEAQFSFTRPQTRPGPKEFLLPWWCVWLVVFHQPIWKIWSSNWIISASWKQKIFDTGTSQVLSRISEPSTVAPPFLPCPDRVSPLRRDAPRHLQCKPSCSNLSRYPWHFSKARILEEVKIFGTQLSHLKKKKLVGGWTNPFEKY